MDSNHRYPPNFLAARRSPRKFTFRNITGSLPTGTNGSNPSRSSGESRANLKTTAAEAERSEAERLVGALASRISTYDVNFLTSFYHAPSAQIVMEPP
jgi:hypothetical protein